MKVVKIDKKENEIICVPQNYNDLWHLEKVLEEGDIIYGSTDRKIKPTKEGEKTERVKLFVELQVIDAHFQEYSENLKINGTMLGGNPEELIELHSHQSVEMGLGEKVRIKKKTLKQWHIDRIKNAAENSATTSLLVVLLDDEAAELAFVDQYAINKKAVIKEKRHGKRFKQEQSSYFDEIFEKIYSLSPKKIVLAGPGFVKENLKKFIEDKKLKGFPKPLSETTNSVGETGFKELITGGKLDKIEKQLQLTKEAKTIEDFLSKLPKGLAEYGREKVMERITARAVEKLIVSETHLTQNRASTEEVLDLAEKNGCIVEIISSRNPQEKTIQGFGGIVATLRYKLERD